MDCLQLFRDQIKARGAKTVRSLGRSFRIMDSFDGNNKLSRSDFTQALMDIGCVFTQE